MFSNEEFRSHHDLFLKEEFCGKDFFFAVSSYGHYKMTLSENKIKNFFPK